MHLLLANLDTGLFFGEGGWTTDRKLAQIFDNTEAIERTASRNKVTNAAAAMVEGDPPRTRGFLWLTKPH